MIEKGAFKTIVPFVPEVVCKKPMKRLLRKLLRKQLS